MYNIEMLFDGTISVRLETNTINLSEAIMRKVIGGDFSELPSHDSGLVYLLQKTVPSIKPLYKSISDWNVASADTDLKKEYKC